MVKVRKSMKYLAGALTCTGDLGMGCVSTSGAILLDYITSIYQPCWRSLGSQEIAKNCKEYIVYEGTANVFTTPNCRVPSCNTDHHPFATIISWCTGTKCWSLVVTIMWDWWFVIPRCVAYFPPFNHIVCICFYISYNILYEYHIMSIYLYIIYTYTYINHSDRCWKPSTISLHFPHLSRSGSRLCRWWLQTPISQRSAGGCPRISKEV